MANLATMAMFGTCRGLNLAERNGICAEVVRMYANMSVAFSMVPLHPVARYYARKAFTTEAMINDPLARAWILEVIGIYHFGLGDWPQAESSFIEGRQICEAFNDRRRWKENHVMLATSRYMQGHFENSAKLFEEVLSAANRDRDLQAKAWGLRGQAQALLPLGQTVCAIRLLEEAARIENIGKVDKLGISGVQASAYLQNQDYAQAADAAAAGLRLISSTLPTASYVLPGYAGVAETYLALYEKGERHLRQPAIDSVRALKRFARVFPLGRPKALLCAGKLKELL